MAEPIRMGVLGAGAIGIRCALTHLSQQDVQDRVVLGAVADPAPGRAQAAGAQTRGGRPQAAGRVFRGW